MGLEEQIARIRNENHELRERLRAGGGNSTPPGGPPGPDLPTRVASLERDSGEIRAVLLRLEPVVIRMDEQLRATLPHLATKADLGDKPSRAYMWGILAALLTAYAAGLAALAILK